jgi:ASC-1-like (ASCH) protein
MERIVEINIGDPWFAAVKSGRKTVEGRLDKGKFGKLRRGDVLVVSGSTGRKAPFLAVVRDVRRYGSFETYLVAEGMRNTLPGVTTVDEGIRVYRQFYSESAEREHGVLAIEMKTL